MFIAAIVAFACLPFSFLVGLLRSRIGRGEEIRTALTAENEQLNAELEAKARGAARLARRASSRRATRSGAGSSATSTTAPSSGWSR